MYVLGRSHVPCIHSIQRPDLCKHALDLARRLQDRWDHRATIKVKPEPIWPATTNNDNNYNNDAISNKVIISISSSEEEDGDHNAEYGMENEEEWFEEEI